jgi:hypothetical protein
MGYYSAIRKLKKMAKGFRALPRGELIYPAFELAYRKKFLCLYFSG